MKPFTHKECLGVRGIKFFKCERCGIDSSNYSNGINTCHECCIKNKICEVCGKEMPEIGTNKFLDIESSVVINLFDNNSNRTIHKVLTIREVKEILKILGTDFYR